MIDFAKTDQLKEKLQSLRPLNATEIKRLRTEFIIDNTYNSNAIEGNSLTLRETAMILSEGIAIGEKPIKDHLEAIGHKDAFEYMLTLVEASTPLSERVIKDIHSLVLMDNPLNRGVYRGIPVIIQGALHTPPQPYLVSMEMERLVSDYDTICKEKHIIQAAAELHLRFEFIHPFVDGNGRTGRLLLNFELMKAGLLPVNIRFADNRQYYKCFDDYATTGSAETLVNLITEYENMELEKYIGIIEGK